MAQVIDIGKQESNKLYNFNAL